VNKLAAALPLLIVLVMPAQAELLELSRLKKNPAKFTVKLDIFNGQQASGGSRPAKSTPAQVADVQKAIAEEIFQSVIYEGFVIKDAKESALLNVSGEFYMVSQGDQILGKIKILSISRSVVAIEYEGQAYDIRIKGDQNG